MTLGEVRRAGGLWAKQAGHRTWAPSVSADKWDVLAAVGTALWNETPVLFAGPTFSGGEVEVALGRLGDLGPGFASGHCAFLTSGSTGAPKLVVHEASSLEVAALAILDRFPQLAERRFHHLFPANYMAGVLNCLVVPMFAGGIICVDQTFDFRTPLVMAERVAAFGSDAAWLSPGMVSALASRARRDPDLRHALAGWKLALNATGPLSAEQRTRFRNRIGCDLANTFGTTEHMFISAEEPGAPRVTAGSPLDGVSLAIGGVVPGDEPISTGVLEVATGSGAIAVLPLDRMAEVDTIERDSLRPTGDLASWDGRHLHVDGRADDLVIIGGLNVSVRSIENAATTVEGVLDSCCFLIGEGRRSNLCLAVEVEPGVGERDVLDGLARVVPPDQYPGRVRIEPRLPRTATGKLDRVAIRESACDWGASG